MVKGKLYLEFDRGRYVGQNLFNQQEEAVTFRWFVKERYIPMRQGKWSPAYKQTNTDQIERYLISRFGEVPLNELDSFQIQIWLNSMAEKYSNSVVRSCFSNIRAITAMARKQKFLTEDPGET